ncbi:MAG: hypothetical protein R3A52_21180 [Polyangiales bacterium]
MKRCPVCGRTFGDEVAFCAFDASALVGGLDATMLAQPGARTEAVPVYVRTQAMSSTPPPVVAPAQRSLRAGPMLAVLGAGALVGAVGVVWLLRGRDAGARRRATGASTQATRAAAPRAESAGAPMARAACAITSTPTTITPRVMAGDDNLLARSGDRVAVGFAAPPRFRHGGDDPALVTLGWDGAVTAVVDPPSPSDARGLTQSPFGVARVRPWFRDGEVTSIVDAVERSPSGALTLRCGDLASALHHDDDLGSVTWNPTAIYFCRTFPVADGPPAVLGVRPNGGDGRSVELVRWGPSWDQVERLWLLPRDADPGAVDPLAELRRRDTLGGSDLLHVPNFGYAFVFRYHGAMRFAWLDESMHLRGELTGVPSLGDEPGRPSLAYNGRAVSLIFADRPRRGRRSDAPTPYRVHRVSMRPGEAPGLPVALAAEAAEVDEFAPSIAVLADGSWLVASTYGMHRRRPGDAPRQVMLRRWSADWSRADAPVMATALGAASDPEVITDGHRFVMVAAAGEGRERSLVAVGGRCD